LISILADLTGPGKPATQYRIPQAEGVVHESGAVAYKV